MILIAPDKFKGTYSSAEIGEKIENWLRTLAHSEEIIRIEMADGGEGTSQILAQLNGLQRETEPVYDPSGKREFDATYFISGNGREMYVDSASFLGRDAIADLQDYSPMDGTSAYFGQFLKGMNQAGVNKMIIGVGGTMTVDGGAGLLEAMGYLFIDNHGDDVAESDSFITPRDLSRIYRIIPTNRLRPMFDQMKFRVADEENKYEITALVDVKVPVTPYEEGEMSSLSFAPQKGVKEDEMEELEDGLSTLQESIENLYPYPFLDLEDTGAGGGLAMGLKLCNATIVNGAEFLLDAQLSDVDTSKITHIYTGEGCFDLQSFQGKVTGTIIERFAKKGIPVTIICGRVDLPEGFHLPEHVEVKLLSELEL